jgi:secreted trypsin-like serine protease
MHEAARSVKGGRVPIEEVRMRTVLFLLLAASGCGAPDPDEPGVHDEAIQGGARDAHDPAVGLVWLRGGGFCSGTLVAPDVVLTAGHCVEGPVAGFYTGVGRGAPGLGRAPIAGLVKHRVIDQAAHPTYQSVGTCPNPTFDVALLRLEKPITATRPLPIAEAPPRAGATCRTVGYGEHEAADGRVTVEQRRAATERVMAVEATAIRVERKSGIVDHGDSGGPLVCDGRLAGVTSCGNDGSGPGHREAYHARVDAVGDWIAQTVAGWQ